MTPDTWTSSIVAALFVAVLTALQLAMWRRRATYRGLGRRTAAMALFSLSMFGIAASPPTIIWILLIGPALVAALILTLEACREFRGLRPQLWTAYLAAAMVLPSGAYFEYVRSLNARIVVMNSFFALIALVCAVTLLRKVPVGQTIGSRFTGGVFAAFAFVSIARLIYYQFGPPLTDFYQASWFGRASFGAETLLLMFCMLGWLVMVDERRLAELKCEQARANSLALQATAADGAKTELMAMIGHEVRNPLSGLIATCDLMLGTELTAEQREYAMAVDASVEALLRVTDDILDLSRMESGGLKIEASPFDLRGHIEGIAKVEEPLARAKRIGLVVDFADSIPLRLIGDPGRIRQVIMNLVGNAVKFTSQGQVRIAVAYLAHDVTEGELRVAVTDTGIGIAAEHLEKLFDKGSSAHASTSQVYGGRGIGLTISQKLIDLMGGRLEVESQFGQGSTFRVSFPVRVPGQASSARQG